MCTRKKGDASLSLRIRPRRPPARLGHPKPQVHHLVTGEAANLVTAVSPIFVVIMGSAYGLHYTTHFMDGMSEHRDRRELTVETMRMVGKPIVLTAITTMAGFASLAWSDVGPIRQMGIFVPLGIGYAGFLSLVFLPALLTRISLPAGVRRPHVGGFTELLTRVPHHRRLVIFSVVVLVTLSAVSASSLKVVSDQLMFFKEGSPIRQTFDKVEDNFGGALTIIGEIPAGRGLETLRDYEYAEDVLDVERELERMPGVVSAHSLFDMVLGSYASVTGHSEYPENPNTVHRILVQMDEEDLESWYADDGLRLVVRTEDLSREDVARLRQFESEKAEVRTLNGTPSLYDELSRLTVEGQVKSLGLALALVFIMLIISLRRGRAALIALAPILITVLAIMGVLALSGFHLNLVTATLSAVAVGVGGDYSIHLISGIEYYRKRGLAGPEAVEAALSTVSRPILANAFELAIGLSVLFLSPLHIHTQVATVMWVAMMVSSLVALTLIPLFYQANSSGTGLSPNSSPP
ncbi:MAG: efflux RND transporter permease subunit [Chloroflexota bacterium]